MNAMKTGDKNIKPGYKKTKLGWIPEDWGLKKLSDVIDLESGQHLSPDEYNNEGEGSPYFTGPTDFCSSIEEVTKWTQDGGKYAENGDILITVKGSGVGTLYISDLKKVAIGRQLMAIKPQKMERGFLYNFLKQRRQVFEILASGNMIPGLSRKDILSFRTPCPPKEEQKRIAEIFSSWDEVISKTVKLIKAKKRYKKGLIQRLFTGKARFPEFEGEDWVEKRLGKVVKQVKRKVPKPEEDYLSIGIRSHGNGTFQKPNKDPDDNSMTSLYKVKEDDLIVNITFAWEGAIAIVKKEDSGGYVSHRFPTYEFDTSKLIPEYFQYVITQPWFVYKLGLISPGGAGRNRVLNKKDFLKLKIDTPSVFEQKAIAGVLTTVDKEIELLELQLKKYQEQKKGLMQKLLTGKVRVN